MPPISIVRLTLIIGVTIVFVYFGIDKFVSPLIWIGWLPSWMDGLLGLGKSTWIQIIGAAEIIIAVLLFIPVRIVQKTGALLAVLHLAAVLTQTGWNDVAVRDIGLLFMTVALWYALDLRVVDRTER